MNRDDVSWKGYWSAVPTPYAASGEVCEEGLRALLEMYVEQGVDGCLINGTTGEWFSQSEAERKRVAEIAVEAVGGRMPVVVGCSAYTAALSSEFGNHAKSIGADGILATPPPYSHPTDDEIFVFYQHISDSVDAPLMIYNWGRGTNVEIRRDLAVRLAGLGNVVALKESSTDRAQCIETIEAVADKLRVFCGIFMGDLGLALLQTVGGDGSIDGTVLPGMTGPAFYDAYWQGDLAAASSEAAKYGDLMGQLVASDWGGIYGSPQSQVKAALNILGQPGGYPRPPLLPVDDDGVTAIREILASAGLLQETATTV